MPERHLRLRLVSIAIMALSLIGLLDSGYLTAHKLFGTPLRCGVVGGCEIVSQSPYSMVFGVPLSLIGMLFYLTMFFGALTYREFGLEKVLKAVAILSVVSILTSAWLVGVQLFVIKAICIYCMISAGISFVLVNLGVHILLTLKKITRQTSVPSPLPDASD
ncbi:MAG: vitamin K epoxide reductase family protein [Patescibacteria group bacterium]|jgi:uncharacterized membrane protein